MSELKNQNQRFKNFQDTGVIEKVDPQVFSDMVDREQRANLVMDDVTAVEDTRLVGAPGSSIDIPRTGTVEHVDKTEGEATDPQTARRGTVNVSVSTKQTIVRLTDEAEEDSLLNEPEEIAMEIGEAIAERHDEDAYSMITDADHELDVDEFDGDTLGDRVREYELEEEGVVDYKSAKDLAFEMRQERDRADSLVLSFEHAGQLLDEDKFILVNESGTSQGLREGMIGRFAGLEVYVTEMADGISVEAGDIQGVVLDSERAFVKATKRQPTFELDREGEAGYDSIIATSRYGYEVLNPEAIGWLVNPAE